jgi:hypothetical protein
MEQTKERRKEYYLKNRDKILQYWKEYRLRNRDKYLQSRKDAAINQMITNSRIREQFENQNAQLRQQSEMYNAGISD